MEAPAHERHLLGRDLAQARFDHDVLALDGQAHRDEHGLRLVGDDPLGPLAAS